MKLKKETVRQVREHANMAHDERPERGSHERDWPEYDDAAY